MGPFCFDRQRNCAIMRLDILIFITLFSVGEGLDPPFAKRSIDVYRAVTELGITTPERFLSDYYIQRD